MTDIDGPRVLLIGTTGTGKTTLAKRLAHDLQLSHTELDDLFWQPGWQLTPLAIFTEKVAAATAQDSWIICGNYCIIRPILWERATHIVWLDYAIPIVLCRLARRTLHRAAGGESCCNGNHETWRRILFSRESPFAWFWRTHRRFQRQYPGFLAESPAQAIVLSSPRHARQWLRQFKEEF